MMIKLIVLLAAVAISLGANTGVVADLTTEVASRVQVYGSGSAITVSPNSATVGTINMTGAGWYSVLPSNGNLITTVNGLSGGTAGDMVVFTIGNATRDVVFLDGSNLKLGANRVLDNLSDTLSLIYSGSDWYERGFVSND